MATAWRRCLSAALVGAVAAAAKCDKETPEGICRVLRDEGEADVAGVELLQVSSQKRAQDQQIPGFDDIFDAANDALNTGVAGITDSINNLTNSVASGDSAAISDSINSLTKEITNSANTAAGSVTTQAAVMAAEVLNETLLVVSAEADKLMATCERERQRVVDRINRTRVEAETRLEVLEDQVTQAVNNFLPAWENVSAAVSATAVASKTALSAVGLETAADTLSEALTLTLTEANAVADSLRNVSALVQGIKDVAAAEAYQRLGQINATLEKGLKKVDAFADSVSGAFDNLTDTASKKIRANVPGSNGTEINAAFDQVDASARSVAGQVDAGVRRLFSGLSASTAMAEETLPPQERSSAVGARAAAALLVCILGVVVA